MKNEKIIYKIIKGFFLGIFLYLLLFLIINLFYSSMLNIYTINSIMVMSLFLGQLFYVKKIKYILSYILGVSFIYILFFYIYKYINGYSVDGNSYHLEGIIELLNGRSLFFERFSSTWLNYYPKNIEIIFTGFVSVFTNYDFGRFFKPLLIIASFINVYYFLLKYKKDIIKILGIKNKYLMVFLTLIIVLNPVVIYQFFTLYLDDILYLLFLNFGIFLFKKEYLLAFILFFIISGGKFTYIFYSCLLFLGFIVSEKFILKNKLNFNFSMGFSKIIFLLVGIFVGFHQYIINLINKGNPLYILIGEGKIDIISRILPDSFNSLNNLERFISSFSKYTVSGCYEEKCWNNINLFNIEGIKEFFSSYYGLIIDPLANGFGNIFYILVILSFLLLIVFIFNIIIIRTFNKKVSIFLLFLLFIFLIINIIPLPWARYYPFLYLFPIISLFLIGNKFRFFKKIILFLYMVNLILVTNVFLKFHYKLAVNNYREKVWIKKDLNKINRIFYSSQYNETYGHYKIIKRYDILKNNFFLLKDKSMVIEKCDLNISLTDQITYCKNGIFIYPNYGSFLGEYMFLEYKK